MYAALFSLKRQNLLAVPRLLGGTSLFAQIGRRGPAAGIQALKSQERWTKLLTSHNIHVLRFLIKYPSFETEFRKWISASPASPPAEILPSFRGAHLTLWPGGMGKPGKHVCSDPFNNRVKLPQVIFMKVMPLFLMKPLVAKRTNRAQGKNWAEGLFCSFASSVKTRMPSLEDWTMGLYNLSVSCFCSLLNRETFVCVAVLRKRYVKIRCMGLLCHRKRPYRRPKNYIANSLMRRQFWVGFFWPDPVFLSSSKTERHIFSLPIFIYQWSFALTCVQICFLFYVSLSLFCWHLIDMLYSYTLGALWVFTSFE